MRTIEVTREYYMTVLSSLPTKKRIYLDEFIEAEKYYLCFEGLPMGGFCITDNELHGLFSLKKYKGATIMNEVQNTKRFSDSRLTLSCIGDSLRNFYIKCGFVVKATHTWDAALAPKGWMYGTPNVYEMQEG